MNVRRSVIISRVLRLLDENEEELDRAMVFGDAGSEMRRLVADLLPDAVRKVLAEAPREKIGEAMSLTGLAHWNGDILELRLPADFLRLVDLRLDGWTECLHDFGEPEVIPEPETRGEVLRHHPRGPVAMHVARYKPAVTCCVGAGGRTLRIFGGVRGADMAVATYLPAPDDSADTQSVWIPRSLTGDVAHELADMVKDVIYG